MSLNSRILKVAATSNKKYTSALLRVATRLANLQLQAEASINEKIVRLQQIVSSLAGKSDPKSTANRQKAAAMLSQLNKQLANAV